VRRIAGRDERAERDPDPAAGGERARGGDRPPPALARPKACGQLRDEAPRRAETRKLRVLVALLQLAHVARREQHQPERLLDGDRLLAKNPGDIRPVLDLDVRLPAGPRHGEAPAAEDEAR